MINNEFASIFVPYLTTCFFIKLSECRYTMIQNRIQCSCKLRSCLAREEKSNEVEEGKEGLTKKAS